MDVASKPVGALRIGDDGTVDLTSSSEGDVDAVIRCDSEADYAALVSGRLNPVVAALQGRLQLLGDVGLATKVTLALVGKVVFGDQARKEEP